MAAVHAPARTGAARLPRIARWPWTSAGNGNHARDQPRRHRVRPRLIDAAHVALLTERDTRTEVAAALGTLSTTAPAPVYGRPLTVGELARRLGVHPATLRTWETEGILSLERDRATGYRQYGPAYVRDVEIARQLRRGCIGSRSSSNR